MCFIGEEKKVVKYFKNTASCRHVGKFTFAVVSEVRERASFFVLHVSVDPQDVVWHSA